MKSYEALEKAINRKTREYAKMLGLSTSLVGKWQEPTSDWSDPGALNPLDRIEAVIEKSLADENDPDKAFAPVYYLTNRFNMIAIPVPDCKCLGDLSKELHESIKEFGHLITAATEAMSDGTIDKKDAVKIEEEGQDLIRHVMAFMKKAQEAVK